MKRFARLALPLAVALGLGPAAAQDATPDVPSGPARLIGQVLIAGERTPVPGVEVALYALTRQGIPGLRRAQTDAGGEFVFENVANDPAIGWLVGARYRGVPFPGGRVSFEEGQTELRVEITVDETTQDPSAVTVTEQRLRLVREPDGLRVIETLALTNTGARTYYAGPEQRASAGPALALRLPTGASGFNVPLGVMPDGLVHEEDRLRWYGPVYPGSQELSWSYELAPEGDGIAPEDGAAGASRFEFSPEVPPRTERLVVLLADGDATLTGDALAGPEETRVEGRPLQRYAREAPPAGPLALALTLPPARLAPDAVSVSAVRLVVRADDAALDVTETHVLDVRGGATVLGTADAPLVRIPLPEAARRLRFGSDRPGLELAPHTTGGLAAVGSVPPGEAVIELAYQLPAGEEPATLERSFAARIPVLSIFVADTGQLAPRSERLHRRRPLRTPDRTYLHLEAFEVAAGEVVALELGRLPARSRSARPLALGAVGLAALASIWLLTSPLRTERREATGAAEPDLAPAREEREAVYDAIRDLDHDFETGKLSAEDHERLRDELRARALTLLEAERAAADRADAPEPVARRCSACDAEAAPAHRFCAQCGHALPDPAAHA
jgi:hypothetical protein